eukprot:CAMPEP_0197026670 /NCGR_PEP_ID=MMETSP1384-20130603/6710_1 /TAXON_ID=29189 /ORGANISM="Ammonia sp." /LENGTH=666 /DNA_ID=CAMNT_0042455375 /DNA_START=24 /DNA_END=2024 /DNA_ORIENTATION=+
MSHLNDQQYVYEEIALHQDEEYRIYLKQNEWVRLWMIKGSAEIFGTELQEAKRNEQYKSSHSRSHPRHSKKFKAKHKSAKMSIDEVGATPHDVDEPYHIRHSYLFSNTNISIYTYQGTVLCIKYQRGQCEHKFKTSDTQYQIYCNYNASLTNMRRSAEARQIELILEKKLSEKPSLPKISADLTANDFSGNENKIIDMKICKQIDTYGPRVLILGPPNSGKTSLAKILANYALRSQSYPLLVDLDCSLNMISIPGTIGAVPICEPIDPETGFNHSHSLNAGLGKKGRKATQKDKKLESKDNVDDDLDDEIKEESEINPIIYFYGDDHPDRRLKVYEKCVEKLSLAVKKKLLLNLESRASGIIVKCHGCLNNPSDPMKNLIANIIKLFHIDVVLVIDDELTMNYLRNKYKDNIDTNNYQRYLKNKQTDLSSYWKNRFIAIEKAVKSGGVMVREQSDRLTIGRNIIRNYFYGPHNTYRPLSCETYPQFLRIYQIGSGQTQNDLLPADQRSVVESFGVLPVRFDASLRGQILAVLHIDNGVDEKEQYQIEHDINNMANNHHSSFGGGDASNINVSQILMSLIETDPQNELIMWNRNTQTQISKDPFDGNAKLKNKLIRSSNVMGFVHVQEVKYAANNRAIVSKLTLLNPCMNKLPLKCLLKGHINWHDR